MILHQVARSGATFLQCNCNPTSFYFSSPTKRITKAVEKDSSEFEVDADEARQALRKLDNQLQSLSTKQLSTPKIRATEVKQWSSEEEGSEISGSFWKYALSYLLLFTIFYNVLFVTVIKPSIDGPQPVESSIDVIE